MEFRFNINRLLPRKINRISHTLIPEDFKGDRRELHECQRLLSRVLDDMGEASACAQGLSKPITSASKLRDTDHLVYLLVDSQGNNGYGCVVGLLKTGSKNLFMFDEDGLHYQLQPRCILDFYVHDSRQRMGMGNMLYQHMLAEEKIRPVKLAIDRPSEKFLRFLHKHYGLDAIIPQNNKFVVFRGFFDDECEDPRASRSSVPSRSITDGDPRSNYENRNSGNDNCRSASSSKSGSYSGVSRSAYGRYAAARPPCSMANIIHNAAVLGQTAERTGEVPASASKLERPRSLSLYSEMEQKQRTCELSTVPTPALPDHQSATIAPEETAITDDRQRRTAASSVTPAPSVHLKQRAPSAVFGSLVDRETTKALSAMNLEEPVENSSRTPSAGAVRSAEDIRSVKPASAVTSTRQETASTSVEKGLETATSAGSIKASPSCAQEVGGTQSGHLDLKFYHSPLW